jgi:hypothetical protein
VTTVNTMTAEQASARTKTFDAWRLLALSAGLGAVLLVRGPIRDPDVFWHTLVGQYTLDGRRFPHPDPWAFTLPAAHWHSTSWLSELGLAMVYDLAGLAGLVALRLLLLALLLTALHWLLVRGRSGWHGPVVFAAVVLPIAGFVQERPQTVSLLFACWLAAQAAGVLFRDHLPSRWRVVPITWLWAMFHGLFVLVPAVLLVLAVGQLVDNHPGARQRARHLTATAILAALAAALTPMGPRLLLAPITVGAAARDFISEWAPTRLDTLSSWGFAWMTALIIAAWARGRRSVPRSHVLWLLFMDTFAFSANRNTAPTSILLGPLAVAALQSTWPRPSTIRVSRPIVMATACLGLLAVVLSYATAPVLGPNHPRRITARLAAQPGVVRVFDDYNVSGFLLREAWPHVRVAIDGRADRYGDEELHRYSDAVNGAPGWRAYVDGLRPDAALLLKKQALTQLLREVEHWQVVMSENDWVLLAPPGSPLLAPESS